MHEQPGPVTADDVLDVAAAAVEALRAGAGADWSARAGGLDWDCWETAEHLADDFFAYAAQLGVRPDPAQRYLPVEATARHPDGPPNTIRVDPATGPEGLFEVLTASAALLAAMVRVTPPTVLAMHVHGLADPEASAAMGVLEALAHVHDIARGLGVEWAPDAGLCARVLARLMPDVVRTADAWTDLRWATGRADLPDRRRRTAWSWDNTPPPGPRRHRPAPGIGLVTLVVPDYDEAIAFYVGAAGFVLLEDTPLDAAKRWVVVASPGGFGAGLLLARADGEQQRARVGDQTGGRVALFLYTADIAADHSRMRAAGVPSRRPRERSPTAGSRSSSTPTATAGTCYNPPDSSDAVTVRSRGDPRHG